MNRPDLTNTQRTLGAQPSAAAHVGATSMGTMDTRAERRTYSVTSASGTRTRLERMLLAAQQMQQH